MTQASIKDWGKVAVLAGGCSPEREVSLDSGQAVYEALCAQGIDAVLLDVQDDVEQALRAAKPDRVFIVLHGGEGENGGVQAICEQLGLPYTGPDVQACALSMDKVACKQRWQAEGLPTLPFVVLDREKALAPQVAALGFPLAIKPSNGGSSLGVSCVTHEGELAEAVALAAEYDDCVMAEAWAQGAELTVPVVGLQALPVVKINFATQFYDYHAKYEDDRTTHERFVTTAEKAHAMQQLALSAYHALGCEGWGRVDFLEDDHGQCYLLELNSVPGMTVHSGTPVAASYLGMSMEQLVFAILASKE